MYSTQKMVPYRSCWLVTVTYKEFWDLVEWLERLAVNAKVATVIGSIPASSDTVESEGRQMKQCLITYVKWKSPQISPFKLTNIYGCMVADLRIVRYRYPCETYLYRCMAFSDHQKEHIPLQKVEGWDWECYCFCVTEELVSLFSCENWEVWRVRIRMDPHHFVKPNLDPHQRDKGYGSDQSEKNRIRIRIRVKIPDLDLVVSLYIQ